MLPDVAPVSGRNGADVEAMLADPTAPVVEPAPSAVVEPAVSSAMGAVQPVVDPTPPTGVVSEGGAEFAPPETQVEMAATTPSPVGLDVATLASEGEEQSVPPATQATADEAGEMEAGTAGGSSDVVVVARRRRRESPRPPCREACAPLRGGSRRSSGCPLGIPRRLPSRLTIMPRAWSGRALTLGSRA